CARLDSNYDSW
nr:immunoglobulin heavy chain junction region [Macaca mulatta]